MCQANSAALLSVNFRLVPLSCSHNQPSATARSILAWKSPSVQPAGFSVSHVAGTIIVGPIKDFPSCFDNAEAPFETNSP